MLKKTTSSQRIRFKSTPSKDEFLKTLSLRVNNYFKENNTTRHANAAMITKTVIILTSWAAVYTLIISDVLSNSPWLLMLAFLGLGLVNTLIAFNIVHDACHGAYSANPKVNKVMGYSMNFVGGNAYLFTMMHNAHHAFVNIRGIDVTLETHGLFRFTPAEPFKKIHRFQHIYTPLLYAMVMIHWVLIKDFKWMFAETNIGNNKDIKHPKSEIAILMISKAFYYTVTLVLPLIFLSAPWWLIVLGWINIHIIPGAIFAFMFQVTHVFDGTCYPVPDKDGSIENNYAIHVLETTADFSRKNPIHNWWMGCINIHVIHHVLPKVCHVHYPPLTKILKETADEFGVRYQENKTFGVALKKHMKMLKHLSKPDAQVPEYQSEISYATN